MNIDSSRSHAILTITVEASKALQAASAGSAVKAGDDVITSASLHIVDLAGSERVAKVGLTNLLCVKINSQQTLLMNGVWTAVQTVPL